MNANLGAAPRDEVLGLAARLMEGRQLEHLQVPQEGLWLLRLAEPVRGDRYFLGEVPVGQAAVRLLDPVLGEARGGAVLLHADSELAVAAAVCAAVHDASWPEADAVAALAASGAGLRAEEAATRAAIRARTMVAFAELGQEEA